MKGLLDYLVRKGLRRGVARGETVWLVLGGTALALRLVMRALRKEQEVVFSEKLAVGHSIVVSHLPASNNGRREVPAPRP